jgi:hypothetical protein
MPGFVTFPFIQCHHVSAREDAGGVRKDFSSDSAAREESGESSVVMRLQRQIPRKRRRCGRKTQAGGVPMPARIGGRVAIMGRRLGPNARNFGFMREAPEMAVGSDRRAGKRVLWGKGGGK